MVQAATGGIIQSGSYLTNNGAGLLNLQAVLNETVEGDPLNRVGDNEAGSNSTSRTRTRRGSVAKAAR